MLNGYMYTAQLCRSAGECGAAKRGLGAARVELEVLISEVRSCLSGGARRVSNHELELQTLDMMRINPDPDFGVPRLVPSQAPDLGTLRDVRDFREVGVD